MKIKTIKKILDDKFQDWLEILGEEKDLPSETFELIEKNAIITGGAIASMLLREEVNDFDIYFRTKAAALAVANYYVARFNKAHGYNLGVTEKDDRISVTIDSGRRGETAGDLNAITDSGTIEDTYQEAEKAALETDDKDKPKYRPVFISTNAITLSNKVQLVLRFWGEPDDIHKNYDFVHCTNYWCSWNNKLCLRQEALESILTKELRYVGSKYPVCSVIRLRKFIQRQWTVNAGQILKMIMQINELDLTDIEVLRDQLTGVDSAYFCDVLRKVSEKDPTKINSAYLVEIIDRMF